ncbi:hypothetical protein IEQ44_03460 [Nocardioides sp. Y6]|uniref:SH3 domain-containing protein n=1 Tax=Nocardioides malaquae TaxID=2773426 RepID=A0ABR9RQ66_9ACTN|nr:hypothetical protein [Nocardioides malaquae]MBE7323709.1 hypothetical protein [Nocardioides malaquae]
MLKSSLVVLATTVALLAPPAAAAPSGSASSETASDAARDSAVAVRTLKPSRLPRGPAARLPLLQGRTLRPSDGAKPIRVRVPAVKGQLRLLGQRSDGRWLVAAQTRSWQRVYAVRRDGSHRAVPRTRTVVARSNRMGWLLARGGERLVQTRWGAYTSGHTVRDATSGEVIERYSTDVTAFPLDADGERLVVRLDAGVRDLVPGESNTAVVKAGNAAFIARDLVFAKTKGLQRGPTSIEEPTTPEWAARFAALDVSPGGELVLGTRTLVTHHRRPRVLELRRMSDGTLVRAFRYGGRVQPRDIHTQDEQTARFESDSAFVLEVRRGGRSILVRCTPEGSCERASRWGRRISVPFEKYVWWRRLNS